ncbi:sortase A [Mobilisporobacter senegalensis]|uniref:Sortase A n=1 Tax=Mobilisporobacter senegalensis TaxID=1329262 RepID=A0A3N1XGE0_9FIRM|nr:class D sortase [Mobilisporobacter senegalensis]ROR23877.1 sortase A [Mobilisporobacter senegalensis]
MKSYKNNRNNQINHVVLILFSVILITWGVWFSGANLNKLFIGFHAGKTVSANEETAQENQNAANEQAPLSDESLEQELYPESPEIGEEFGELYIPKIKATLPIYEGTNEEELEKGVGHYIDSVLPGENDNSVLSGHRDTVFRKLGDVGEGDLLIVRTSAGEFKYKVRKVRIVDEDDRTVIVPKPNATLTVSTCYPFHYIGSAPQRYVLVAYLNSKEIY